MDYKLFEEDFINARRNISIFVDDIKFHLIELGKLAYDSQTIQFYESYDEMSKSLAKLSLILIKLHEEKNKIDKKEENNPGTIINNLFVGSTSELQKYLEEVRNKSL